MAEAVSKSNVKSGSGNFLGLSSRDLGLYAAIVFAWGTSWYALKLQVGVVAPHVSLTWRFGLAAILMMVIVRLTRRPMRFPPRDHIQFIALGFFLFSTNFALFYYGAQWITSGLLAVVFSLASIINIALAFAIYRQTPALTVLAGASLGVAGIIALFWPEIANANGDAGTLIGLGLCIAGTLSFCIGNLFSARLQKRGLSVMASNAWGMFYGTIISALIAYFSGAAFIIDASASYVLSLFWLVVFSTVIAFWSYLTLLGSIGSARAGYATVMFPVIALLISTVVEDYQWSALAAFGAVAALLGNLFVMRGKKIR